MLAARTGNVALAEALVREGADLSIRADAIDWGSQITNEPRVMYRPVGGLTPLLYAARAGRLDCVKTMIAAGADKEQRRLPLTLTSPRYADRPIQRGLGAGPPQLLAR